ncbi:MAG: ABC transporter ATP-binding protein [Spirochaetales bacterium]|nr:ABC transporter ATP-binding protein [Spirochaetales bacterium]
MKNKPLRFLIEISKKGKTRLLLSGALIFLSSLASLGPYYVAYLFILRIINSSLVLNELFILSGIAALCVLTQLIFSGIAMTQSHIAAYSILFDLRKRLAAKMLKLPLGYYSQSSSGTLKSIIMNNVEAIEEFVAHNLVDLLSVTFMPIIIFIWLASMNLPLACLSILPVVLGVVLQRLRIRLESENIQKFYKLKNEMNTTIIDFIRGMPVIKAFNQSVFSFRKFEEEAAKYSNYWIAFNKKGSPFFAAYSLLMDCGVIFILPVGAYMYLTGSLPLTSFLLFMFIGLGLSRFMKQLTGFGSNISQILKGVEEIQEVLEAPEIPDTGRVSDLSNFDLDFFHVNFSYGKTPVLKDVSFSVPQGTMTALTGASGAGKTTIGRLVPRFWDVDSGEITIGGVDIRRLTGEALMTHVSFVFQDIFMFNDSILENIRMGNKSISEEEVVENAQKAQAHDFIMRLEDGYHTQIGASGTYLSGGEKQRIAIARALAKKSQIIILDEATSYADTENEAKIQQALNTLLKGKTVLIIAHRLSTISGADQILVFDKGQIVERGTHAELVELQGFYEKMWSMHKDASDWSISRKKWPVMGGALC